MVKTPKGFGKNYFTFSAVLAYSVQVDLHSQVSSVFSLFHNRAEQEDEECELDDPPIELLGALCSLQAKPCHCNCFFKLKTKLVLLCNIFIPRCPYYTTYFAFRRTGVHPPITIL